MRRTDLRGFTLVELVIVAALLVIVAAIAMPSLFRARRSGNESAAISSLRSIVSAQYLYASTCGDGFFAPSLAVLGQAAPAGVSFLGPDLGAGDSVVKSGYTVTMGSSSGPSAEAPPSCNGLGAGQDVRAFWATATPTATAGSVAYGVNTVGTVYYALQETALAMTDTTAPAGALPIPQ
ncbi:MAG: type II secretion system protein [Acidobacteriota bacterium]